MAEADTAPVDRGPTPFRIVSLAIWLASLAFVGWLYLRDPGDAPFIADEPALIAKALTANAVGKWETVGLVGTVGRPYGPVPTWLYQVLLARGLGPEGVVRARVLIVYLLTAVGLLWLDAESKLGKWCLLALLASPYLVFYARQLWDNSLNIPLAAVLAGATASMTLKGRWWALPVWVLTAGLMLLVHPMSVALIGPLGIFAAVGLGRNVPARLRERRLARLILPVLAVLVSGAILAVGVLTVPDYIAAARAATAPFQSPLSSGGSAAWAFAWLGFRNISGLWFDYFFPANYLPGWIVGVAIVVAAAIGISTLGIVAAFIRRGGLTRASGPLVIFVVGLSVVICQMFLNGFTLTYGHPHYYNATWIGWGMMAWAGVGAMDRWGLIGRWAAAVVLAVWLAGVLAINLGWQGRVHEEGGSRYDFINGIRGYGPTIGNQMLLVEKRDTFSADSRIRLSPPRSDAETHHYHLFPFSFDVMTVWVAKSMGDAATRPAGYKPFRQLDIRYAEPANSFSGRMELVPVIDESP